MTKLVCTSPFHFEYQPEELPSVKKNEVLLRPLRIGVCGTDLHAFDGTQPYFTYPRVLGHELGCEVVDANGTDFRNGEHVTLLPYFNCGSCYACLEGKPNCCVNLAVCGVHVDGGMREYFNVPASKIVSGAGLDLDSLALIEPLSIGAHAVRRAAVADGEHVLVIGAGPIGLATMIFAELAGATVSVVDVNPFRLEFCKSMPGNRRIINAGDGDVVTQIPATSGRMPSVVFDATGNLGAINQGFKYMAHGGRYVLVGLQKGDITFSHPDFHRREGTLMSSRNATREDFEFVIDAVAAGRVDPRALITHRLAFGQVADDFAILANPASRVMKAIIES